MAIGSSALGRLAISKAPAITSKVFTISPTIAGHGTVSTVKLVNHIVRVNSSGAISVVKAAARVLTVACRSSVIVSMLSSLIRRPLFRRVDGTYWKGRP